MYKNGKIYKTKIIKLQTQKRFQINILNFTLYQLSKIGKCFEFAE